jgi:hypothetical protein
MTKPFKTFAMALIMLPNGSIILPEELQDYLDSLGD